MFANVRKTPYVKCEEAIMEQMERDKVVQELRKLNPRFRFLSEAGKNDLILCSCSRIKSLRLPEGYSLGQDNILTVNTADGKTKEFKFMTTFEYLINFL